MTHEAVQPPNPEARYHGRPIPPEHVVVEVMWMHDRHNNNELDNPMKKET
jgi:hypothetical protein